MASQNPLLPQPQQPPSLPTTMTTTTTATTPSLQQHQPANLTAITGRFPPPSLLIPPLLSCHTNRIQGTVPLASQSPQPRLHSPRPPPQAQLTATPTTTMKTTTTRPRRQHASLTGTTGIAPAALRSRRLRLRCLLGRGQQALRLRPRVPRVCPGVRVHPHSRALMLRRWWSEGMRGWLRLWGLLVRCFCELGSSGPEH